MCPVGGHLYAGQDSSRPDLCCGNISLSGVGYCLGVRKVVNIDFDIYVETGNVHISGVG